MERLTERHCGVAVIEDKNRLSEAMELLARYEETGLTLEQVRELKERYAAKEPVQTRYGMVCPACGSMAFPWNRFCDECGQRWFDDYPKMEEEESQ